MKTPAVHTDSVFPFLFWLAYRNSLGFQGLRQLAMNVRNKSGIWLPQESVVCRFCSALLANPLE